MKGIESREIFNSDFLPDAEDDPIFYELNNDDIITYNPVVLSINDEYWEELSFYDENEDYGVEMYADSEVIFNSSYSYYEYPQYYWERPFDWNVSHYSSGRNLNLTACFYQLSDRNLNHSESINVTIGQIKETPIIDLANFSINLFHFPGTYYEDDFSYYFYNPNGLNPYYHFTIYEDGYTTLKFGNLELYESKELDEEDATSLIEEIINLGFFQLKDYYFAPSFDWLYHSWYDITIESVNVNESRGADESIDFHINPLQYAKCLQAIKDRVDTLYFEPIRWKWDLFFIIAGSTLGGFTVIAMAIYVFSYKRR